MFLKSPTVLAKTIALLNQPTAPPAALSGPADVADLVNRNPKFGDDVLAAVVKPPDTQKIAYVFSLRNLREGWTTAAAHFLLHLVRDEHQKQGGRSFQKFLDNIDSEAYDNATDVDRLAVDVAGLHQPYKAPELPLPPALVSNTPSTD